MPFLYPVPVVILLLYIFNCIKILREYERGVIFSLGRLLQDAKGPGSSWYSLQSENGARLTCASKRWKSLRRTSLRAITSP